MQQPDILISRVVFGEDEERLILDVVRSGHVAQGPMVESLERAFCELAGTRHAVAVANGTVALVAALQALEIGPGDEVVTSPFTFVATLNAALEVGASVSFADIRLDDFTIDADELSAVVSDRTRVVMPVHLYGQAADCARIVDVSRSVGAAVVEDAAQAHGATFAGRPVGSFGLGCFSLYATKNVTSGEGGVVTTDDDVLADRLRLLRNQGMRARYRYEIAGHNYRMTDLQAALAIPQLQRLETLTRARVRNAALLSELLDGVDGLIVPVVRPERGHVFHQYTVRVTPDARCNRDDLSRELAAGGIGSGIYYPRVVFDYDCYRDHPLVRPADVPNARRAAAEVLSLPVHPALSEDDVARVAKSVRTALGA